MKAPAKITRREEKWPHVLAEAAGWICFKRIECFFVEGGSLNHAHDIDIGEMMVLRSQGEASLRERQGDHRGGDV